MRSQLGRLGLAHDRRREVMTSDPSYYRWTQWIFLRVFNSWYDPAVAQARPVSELIAQFERGQRPTPDGRPWRAGPAIRQRDIVDSYRLAYLADVTVNWCPGLGTVLADEEVTSEGRSAVGNYPVHRRPSRQWMLHGSGTGASRSHRVRRHRPPGGAAGGDAARDAAGTDGLPAGATGRRQ